MIVSRKGSGGSEARTASREITVINKLGVHARPAALFVKTANKFTSNITVEKDGEQVNGKSIMGLMMLAAGQGSKLVIIAEGPDAEAAVHDLELLFQRKFDEE
jgi:phosphocarrier protein HPr